MIEPVDLFSFIPRCERGEIGRRPYVVYRYKIIDFLDLHYGLDCEGSWYFSACNTQTAEIVSDDVASEDEAKARLKEAYTSFLMRHPVTRLLRACQSKSAA